MPWRFSQDAADPYRVWIAEVMLQQTQVAAVIPYYHRFLQRFPTLQSLAAASDGEILALWSGLGYYARGRRLGLAAREAMARYGGLPDTREALSALPGFGPYTSGAVASIAFAQPVPCVDGNVARVLSRLFEVDGEPQGAQTRDRLWRLAEALVPAVRPGDFNQALMELGATVCVKPVPRCERCPLTAMCLARRRGRERELPQARTRRALKELRVACAVCAREGALLLWRQPDDGLFGGLWMLPNVEVRGGETAQQAIRRAMGAAPNASETVRVEEALASVERVLTHRRLCLTAYRCSGVGACSPLGREARYVNALELETLAMPTALRKLLARLPEGFGA